MKRRTSIVVVASLAVILVAVVLLEPTKTVSGRIAGDSFLASRPSRYWAKQLQGGPGEIAAALSILEKHGADAIPVLSEIYQEYPGEARSELRWTALHLLAKQSPLPVSAQNTMRRALGDPDPHVRSVAIAAAPKAGVPAEDVVPILKELLRSEHSVVAARAISEYRAAAAAALPELIAAMHDDKLPIEAQWNAARTIGKIGPNAVSAVPDLIDELDDPEDTIREHAAEAIGDIGPVAAELGVPALRKVLTDRYVKVRRDAVRSLGYIGADARPAAEDILPLLKDPEAIVREAAEKALKTVAPELLPKLLPKEPKPGDKAEPQDKADKKTQEK
ncbi:MAG: HEAT repeat domain-containing protein [Planctomycetaceae bacterium]|nr:HEAT repeat domain-containing protein [Planctomycetaceae bacterium]